MCDKHRKVSSIEQALLKDQRTVQIMFIGNVDKLSSKRLRTKQKRTHDQHIRELKNRIATTEIATVVPSKDIYVSRLPTDPILSDKDSEDDIPLAILQGRLSRKRRHRKYLPTVARACDRLGISDRAAAAIASAVLQDYGIISK